MSFRTHLVFTVRFYEGEEKTPAGSQSFSERDRAMAFFLDKKEEAERWETTPLPRIFEETHEVSTSEISLEWGYV